MPAFMAGMGMRNQFNQDRMRRQQFNKQPPGANQFTQALQEGAGGTSTQTPGTPNTQGQGPGQAPTNQANPYASNANPWTYDPQQGTYQPNSSAWTPEWMKQKPVAPTAPKIKQSVLKDYTPAYGDEVEGTPQQAADMLKAEAAKRGKAINIDEIAPKYAAQLKGGKVTGALYNQIVKDLFSTEEEVDDPNWKAPETPAAPGQRPLPMNPNMGMMGMGGMMRDPYAGMTREQYNAAVPGGGSMDSQYRQELLNRMSGSKTAPNYGDLDAQMRTLLEGRGAAAQPTGDPNKPQVEIDAEKLAAMTPIQQQDYKNRNLGLNTKLQDERNRMLMQMGNMGMQGMGGMFAGYPGMQGGWGG